MVSKANEDFPEPLTPVMIVHLLRGIVRLTALRFCSSALSILMSFNCSPYGSLLPSMTIDSLGTACKNVKSYLDERYFYQSDLVPGHDQVKL